MEDQQCINRKRSFAIERAPARDREEINNAFKSVDINFCAKRVIDARRAINTYLSHLRREIEVPINSMFLTGVKLRRFISHPQHIWPAFSVRHALCALSIIYLSCVPRERAQRAP